MENLSTNFEFSKLEFDKILNEVSKYSLSEECRVFINNIKPSSSINEIIQNHSLLSSLKSFIEKEEKLELSVIYNLKKQIDLSKKKITLNEIQLYELAFSVKTYFHIKRKLFKDGYEILKKIFNVEKFEDLFYLDILKYIDKDGNIDSKASQELKNIRSNISEINEKIHKTANSCLKNYKELGYLTDEIISLRDGLLCIALKAAYKNKIDGIILDTSATGQTVFVVPKKIVELHNDLVIYQEDEKKEIIRILTEFTGHVCNNADLLDVINNDLLAFDILHSKTCYGVVNNYYSPEITNQNRILLYSGKHPVIGEKAVPLDITIGDDFKILVITGPNTGGKTVVLKTIGLFVLMVQSGIPIPASSSSVFSVFKKLFIDIGDDQSIEQSLSTFSSHIKKIINIINNADDNSLILIDEFGTGTDPVEGAGLAMSIIIKLLELKSVALMTTHYTEIKNFASNTKLVENASMEFDGINLIPTYKLKVGIPGASKAFDISKRLGMPDEIIERAKSFISEDMLNIELLQKKLEKELFETGNLKADLEKQKHNVEELKNEIEKIKIEIEKKNKELSKKIRQDKSDFLNDARKEFENIVHKIKISDASKDSIKEGKQLFEKIENELKQKKEISNTNSVVFKKGDDVYIVSKEVNGIILDKTNVANQYLVQVGILKINFDSNDMRLIKPVKKNDNKVNYSLNFTKAQMTLDLRGSRYDEAEKKIDKFIDEALVNKIDTVKIIHGKGTGALKNCIQDYLKNSPFVIEFTFEKSVNSNETNFGVTVARLRC